MRWLDIGWQAHGVVAIGQFATGVVAIGQVAWGVVALGQAAFGFVAVGQLAVGWLTVGMVGAGLSWTAAMVGVGGRGVGFVLPLLPSLGRRVAPPDVRSLAALADGDGWTRLHLVPRPDGRIAVFDGYERRDDVRVDARCRRAAEDAAPGDVWAHVRRSRHGLVADRLIRLEPPRYTRPAWWLAWGAQLMGLMLLAGAVWWLAAEPVLRAMSSE